MNYRKDLEEIFLKNGFNDFKWLDPTKIVVSHWVRMKCIYGCPEYGQNASCPPNNPSVSDCEKFFREWNPLPVIGPGNLRVKFALLEGYGGKNQPGLKHSNQRR